MPGSSDPQRRPVLFDLKNQRFLADPVGGGSYYPITQVSPGALTGDQVISLINTATSGAIAAARVVAASTTAAGVVQLVDAVNSASTSQAPTAGALKMAYDLAAAALPLSGGTMGGVINFAAGQTISGYGLLDGAQTWTKGQRGEVTPLACAASVTLNLADSNHFRIVLDQAMTLTNPLNAVAGQSGAVELVQAASGGPYSVSYGANWAFEGGAPSVSSTASSLNLLSYYVSDNGTIVSKLISV